MRGGVVQNAGADSRARRRNRARHQPGHPPAPRAVGPDLQIRSADQHLGRRALAPPGSAESLERSLDQRATGLRLCGGRQHGPGQDGAGAGRAGRRPVRSSADEHGAVGAGPPGARERAICRPPAATCEEATLRRLAFPELRPIWKKPFGWARSRICCRIKRRPIRRSRRPSPGPRARATAHLQASLLLLAAENMATLGDDGSGRRFLDERPRAGRPQRPGDQPARRAHELPGVADRLPDRQRRRRRSSARPRP